MWISTHLQYYTGWKPQQYSYYSLLWLVESLWKLTKSELDNLPKAWSVVSCLSRAGHVPELQGWEFAHSLRSLKSNERLQVIRSGRSWQMSNLERFAQAAHDQGWELAHRFSERITRFLRKNERMSNWLKKKERFAHSLIFGEQFAHDRSFLVSNLSKSLMVAHFLWATWAICSHRSFFVSNLSDSLTSLSKQEGMS